MKTLTIEAYRDAVEIFQNYLGEIEFNGTQSGHEVVDGFWEYCRASIGGPGYHESNDHAVALTEDGEQ